MSADAKPMLSMKDLAFRILMGGTGGGIGVALVFLLSQVITAQPERAFGLLEKWGPLSILLGMVLFFGYRQNERGIRVQQEVASSQRELAGQMQTTVSSLSNGVQNQAVSMRDMSEALDRVANKDNETLLRMEARLDESCDRSKSILAWIDRQEENNKRVQRIMAWIENEEARLKLNAPNR